MNQATSFRYKLEALTKNHVVSDFDCRYTLINDFLKSQAYAEMVSDLSRTFVLVDRGDKAGRIAGYFTLRADSFYDAERKFGRNPVPVVELAFLARHIDYRGQGLGSLLMVGAFRVTLAAAHWIGVAGIHLAYTTEGKQLYDRFGFGEHPYEHDNLFLFMADIRALLDASDMRTEAEGTEQL